MSFCSVYMRTYMPVSKHKVNVKWNKYNMQSSTYIYSMSALVESVFIKRSYSPYRLAGPAQLSMVVVVVQR